MSTRGLLSALLLGVSIGLGALREFLFVNLNYQLDHLSRGSAWSYAHSAFQSAVSGWDLPALIRLKWLLALLFIGLTLGLTLWLAWVRFGDHRLARPVLLAFALLGGLALLLHFGAARLPFLHLISVQLLHALQYPVPLLLVLAVSWGRRG